MTMNICSLYKTSKQIFQFYRITRLYIKRNALMFHYCVKTYDDHCSGGTKISFYDKKSTAVKKMISAYLCQEPVYIARFGLSESVHPEDGLDVVWRIPRRVKDDDPICRDQIRAETASLSRDEEQATPTTGNTLDWLIGVCRVYLCKKDSLTELIIVLISTKKHQHRYTSCLF